jgi:UDPglucose 6-dehydrogenase
LLLRGKKGKGLMKNITVIGSGYVGLVGGTCLADMGNAVICVDNNKNKIDQLNQGEIPIYEFGLERKVKHNAKAGRLKFTTNTQEALQASDIIFIAVGTPPMEDGSADIQHVLHVSEDIGRYMNGYKLIVIKSTVPVGTGQKVRETVGRVLKERGVKHGFDMVSNPEFLREGSAVYDFMNPDRIVIGAQSPQARAVMLEIYDELYNKGVPFLFTNIETAELIKYASNAFLAMKITFINEMAQLCEKVGADVEQLALGLGMDKRIGADFLKPGPGYGGSCFPKDTRAIVKIAKDQGVCLSLIEQTVDANERQKLWVVDKITQAMGCLDGKTIGILGITYKADTDDMREAPALTILSELANDGARLKIYDPQGEKEGGWRLASIKNSIEFCASEYDAVNGADALVILTDWARFKTMDVHRIYQTMNNHFFFDFRNIFDRDVIEEQGFIYVGIGR